MRECLCWILEGTFLVFYFGGNSKYSGQSFLSSPWYDACCPQRSRQFLSSQNPLIQEKRSQQHKNDKNNNKTNIEIVHQECQRGVFLFVTDWLTVAFNIIQFSILLRTQQKYIIKEEYLTRIQLIARAIIHFLCLPCFSPAWLFSLFINTDSST